MLYSSHHSGLKANKTLGVKLLRQTLYETVLVIDAHLKKIRHEAVISHLENGSFWVLVDSNDSLKGKTQTHTIKTH